MIDPIYSHDTCDSYILMVAQQRAQEMKMSGNYKDAYVTIDSDGQLVINVVEIVKLPPVMVNFEATIQKTEDKP